MSTTPGPVPPDRAAPAVRQRFLDFFTERGHRFVPSSSVVPQGDPTLLFTNAGMNQFKDVFLGSGTRDYRRAANSQKCIRASGKHNDLEDVGRDTYHHTFFEMLGNWSFGDYFKREAIGWAWELLTEVWGLPPERLWATVFAGDEQDGLPPDEEAEEIWRSETGIDPSHVLRCARADNFWEMGDTGPCGPCSEIHIDRGGPGSDPRDGADPAIGVNAGNERFIELWNLVFIQFNRLDDGSLTPLPAHGVDTGMGFERVLAVLQGVDSNYETDLFRPIFARLGELTGSAYGADGGADVAFRVVADHLRAVCSALADGALPSNLGRGYVLRRMIRRAARFGRQSLDVQEPFLWRVVPAVCESLGGAYPEIPQRREHLELVVRAEEESFGKTLDRGLVLFDRLASAVGEGGVLPGAEAFDLYATFGFPKDLVELMARERELEVDQEGWSRAQEAHRAISRSEGMFEQLLSAEQLAGLTETRGTWHEEDERSLELETRALALFAEPGRPDRLVLAETPFYPEGGGQIGDRGEIEAKGGGGFRFEVRDAQRVGGVVVHLGEAQGLIEPGAAVVARVDGDARRRTRANHTATHLLHAALRGVLGEHVTQQGSYVGPERLRFDLSHPRGVAPDDLERIEARVNREIARNSAVRAGIEDLEAARSRGVMALFGEKYEERVRVVEVGEGSAELCGGTHVRATGEIGSFVLLGERALQAGVRRIEALSGEAAVEHLQRQRRLLEEAARELKAAVEDVPARIAALKEMVKAAKKEQSKGTAADVGAALAKAEAAARVVGGVTVVVADLPELDGKGLRELAGRARKLAEDAACALFGREGGRVPFVLTCDGAALARGLEAGKVAAALRPVLGGGGGGRPDLAQGQGQKADSVGEAVDLARRLIEEALEG